MDSPSNLHAKFRNLALEFTLNPPPPDSRRYQEIYDELTWYYHSFLPADFIKKHPFDLTPFIVSTILQTTEDREDEAVDSSQAVPREVIEMGELLRQEHEDSLAQIRALNQKRLDQLKKHLPQKHTAALDQLLDTTSGHIVSALPSPDELARQIALSQALDIAETSLFAGTVPESVIQNISSKSKDLGTEDSVTEMLVGRLRESAASPVLEDIGFRFAQTELESRINSAFTEKSQNNQAHALAALIKEQVLNTLPPQARNPNLADREAFLLINDLASSDSSLHPEIISSFASKFSSHGSSPPQISALAQNLTSLNTQNLNLLAKLAPPSSKPLSFSDLYLFATGPDGKPLDLTHLPDELVKTAGVSDTVLTELALRSIPKNLNRAEALLYPDALKLVSLGFTSQDTAQISSVLTSSNHPSASHFTRLTSLLGKIEQNPKNRSLISRIRGSRKNSLVKISLKSPESGSFVKISLSKAKPELIRVISKSLSDKAIISSAPVFVKIVATKFPALALKLATIPTVRQVATKVAVKAATSLAIKLGLLTAELAGGPPGWVLLVAQIAIEVGAFLIKKVGKLLKDLYSKIGIELKNVKDEHVFVGSIVVSLAGVWLITTGYFIAGVTLVTIGVIGAAATIKSGLFALGGAASSFARFLVNLPSLLLGGSVTGLGFVIGASIIIPIVLTFLVVITSHSAFLAPLTRQSGPPGQPPAECNGQNSPPPQASDILFSSDGKYAFPIAPFSQLWYGCSHWDGVRATDIGMIGDTAKNPPRGAHLPIIAYTSGTIQSTSTTDPLGGKYIILRGDDGRFYYYAHNCALYVSPGDRVAVGDVIASSDNTGSAANTVEHLHFAVSTTGNFVGGGTICPAADFQAKFGLTRCNSQPLCI